MLRINIRIMMLLELLLLHSVYEFIY